VIKNKSSPVSTPRHILLYKIIDVRTDDWYIFGMNEFDDFDAINEMIQFITSYATKPAEDSRISKCAIEWKLC